MASGSRGAESIVIVGGGHNGLVAAFYLARAGLKPLVLEARPHVGGGASTGAITDGHEAPILAHAIGPIRPSIVRDMQLARRAEFLHPDPCLTALHPDGPPLAFSRDPARTADAIRTRSAADASRYPDVCATFERLGAFLAPLLDRMPPSIDAPSAGDVWRLLETGRRFRALGRTDAYRLLRWMPMAVADLAGELFSDDLLKASLAARAIQGTAAGPWSGGTGAALLLAAALDPVPVGSSVTVRGGPGALARALAAAAEEAGATIRVASPVARILIRDERAAGVLLEDGTEVPAATVVSNADPRRTMLTLVDPVELDPGVLQRFRHYRAPGTLAKINFVLNGLPAISNLDPAAFAGRIQVAPDVDYLERAYDASKYGQISAEPYLELSIPSVLDPSLCPPGRHVLSAYMQFAPYRLADRGEWSTHRDQLTGRVIATVERYAPGFRSLIEAHQVLTPVDLETDFGFTGGHIFHGEPSLDQLFTMRPVMGWAQYRMPVEGLFLCGAGTHPGGGITGAPGRNAAQAILRARKP